MAEPLQSPTKGNSSLPKDEIHRRGLSKSENAATPITPPARYISSNFSTPGSTYGKEEDTIIIELSSRYLKAGIEGESHPQCRYNFQPSYAKRLGDYRQWLPGYTPPKESLGTWGEGYELWRNDLKNVDLGLLGDKLERAVRDLYNKHLLVDAGNARLVLVVPSLLPHPVLETILHALFERWAYPSITLLPVPASSLISAGLRSGLVVDIGWEETVITAIYEYREVRVHRSTRAMKTLTKNFVEWAHSILEPDCRLDLETVEDFLAKAAPLMFSKETNSSDSDDGSIAPESDKISLEWPTNTFTRPIEFSRSELEANLRETLLGGNHDHYPDDEELPLHILIYNALLRLPPDIRGICVSRMVFVGEGSDTFELQSPILTAFSHLLNTKGWTEVQGQRVKKREGLSELAQTRTQPADVKHDDIIWSEKVAAEERHVREKIKHTQPPVRGVVRQVETLGPWVGASLLTALKIKSFVEIQRDRFLSHGLNGASKELEISVVPQQRMSTMGIRPKAGERTSWTLSGWG